MSDEEQHAEPEPEATESVPPLDDHHEEAMKEMTLEERQEALTRSRWNVFLYLGLAALMFGFALFPFPFSADLNTGGKTYEQDLGFVWGLPLDGEDFTDVPITVEVTATSPPTTPPGVSIAVYMINSDDCGLEGWSLKEQIREGEVEPSHNVQFQEAKSPIITDEIIEFEFDVDGGNQCLFVEYIDPNNGNAIVSNGAMEVDGDMWPNQIYAGILALLFLGLSGFAFIGAQRHGEGVKALTEPSKKTTEEEVLETVAGPSGPPPSAAGPAGPPPSASGPSGPPQAEPAVEPEPVAEETSAEPVFEAAENGYFYRKMPDGTYDQTVYVQAEDGSYVPYQE